LTLHPLAKRAKKTGETFADLARAIKKRTGFKVTGTMLSMIASRKRRGSANLLQAISITTSIPLTDLLFPTKRRTRSIDSVEATP